MVDINAIVRIEIDKLELDLDNPRHGKVSTPEAAIAYLVEKERVISLALHIAEKGLNPMDLFGVKKRAGQEVYTSVEGNRRVCALLLLHDPERIPKGYPKRAKVVEKLERAIAANPLPKSVNCVVFKSRKAAMPWIETMHYAESEVRRRRWTPDQQGRAMGGGRNFDALQVLDMALKLDMISSAERESTLTTVQRYLGNPMLRASLGLERAKDRTLSVRLQNSEFLKVFSAFIEDVKTDKLSSRSNKDAVEEYAKELLVRVPYDLKATPAIPLSDFVPDNNPAELSVVSDEKAIGMPNLAPPRPNVRGSIGRDDALERELFALNSAKLTSLYLSCATLPLRNHAPLISVGIWSILETLSSLHNGTEATFVKYLSQDRIENIFGISDKGQKKSIRSAIDDISNRGNSTKHSAEAAQFDGGQLANYFDILKPLITAICANIPK